MKAYCVRDQSKDVSRSVCEQVKYTLYSGCDFTKGTVYSVRDQPN